MRNRIAIVFLLSVALGGHATAASTGSRVQDCRESLAFFAHRVTNQLHHIGHLNTVPLRRLLFKARRLPTQSQFVRLGDLKLLRPINYAIDATKRKLEARTEVLLDSAPQVFRAASLDAIAQEILMPSRKPFRVIKDIDGRFAVMGGNGRLTALRNAYSASPELLIEVVETLHDANPRIYELIRMIRATKSLTD